MLKPLLPLFCLIVGISQAQELVKDINAVHGGQLVSSTEFSQLCKPCGGYIYFPGRDKEHGRELWRTDGTTDGTIRLTDIRPGPEDGVRYNLPFDGACLNGFFYIGDAALYKTDGTPEGTTSIIDNVASMPVTFVNQVAFAREGSVYVTNGGSGASVLKEFEQLPDASGVFVTNLKSSGDKLYVQVSQVRAVGGNITEIWAIEGVDATLVYNNANSDVTRFETANDKLFFRGYDDDNGNEFWASDGTPAGTMMLVDSNPGAGSSDQFDVMVPFDDKMLFATQIPTRVTWISDGTPAGTTVVANDFYPYYVKMFHDKVYMSAYGNTGWFLARTDLDFTGFEVTVPDAGSSSSGLLTVAGDRLLYSYEDPTNGIELFDVDEVSAALTLVKDINTGSNGSSPRSFAELGLLSVFIAEDADHGFELWVSDATEVGTTMLKDINAGTAASEISDVYQYNKKLYFLARSTPETKRELWTSDGTDVGTRLIFDDPPLYPGTLIGFNQYVVTDGNGGFDKIDLDAEDNIPLNLPPTYFNIAETPVQPSLAIGNTGFFYTTAGPTANPNNGSELWTVDVTTNDISFVKDINPGPGSSTVYSERPRNNGMGVVLNDKIIFPAKSTTGIEPWVSDGTEEGTMLLKDISAASSSFPGSFVVMGDNVYFIASSDTQGTEIWVTDGTPEGTHILKDIMPGPIGGISEPELAVYNDVLLFAASTDGSPFTSLWSSDGTEEGTQPYDLLPAGWRQVRSVFSAGNNFYFSAVHPDHGIELWTSDATPEGTVLLELEPGRDGSIPENMVNSNGTLYFTANGKIWKNQGSFAGTGMLGEVTPASDLFPTDNYLCFLLDDPEVGKELYRVDLNAPVGQLIMFTGFENFQPGNEYEVSVAASSELPVTLESSDPTVLEIVGSKIVVHKAGEVVFTATQDGDANFNPATSTLTVTVSLIAQTITFAPIAPKTPLDEPFFVNASTTSGLPLTFESGNTSVAEISADGKITIKKVGTSTIIITQAGNENYAAAALVTRELTVGKVIQTITFNELPTRTLGDAPFALTATSTSGLAVVFSSESPNVQITGTNLTMTGAGKATIVAAQPGDDVYSTSFQVFRVFCINPVKPTVTQAGIGLQITLTSSATTNVWKQNDTALGFTGKSFTVAEAGVYKAAAIVDGCQGEFSEGANVVITGLEDVDRGIEIFPNPVEKNLTIRCPAQAQIRIMDMTGKEHINEVTRASESVIDVSSFAMGMYVIVIKDETQTRRSKFLKR